jgi:dipeptidase
MAYHNSFILADPREAWVLETAGHLWAAVKVRDCYAISNGLTIGETFDESHPQLIEHARQQGWLKKGKPFNFARCYSDWFYTTFSSSLRRRRQSTRLLEAAAGRVNSAAAMGILRDHQETDYRPDSHFLGNRICAHAANPLSRNASQTTNSLVANLKAHVQTYWATGTAGPCTSIFKPVWFGGKALPDLGPVPTATYDGANLWWHHEKLHRLVLLDLPTRLASYRQQRNELENDWLQQADGIPAARQAELTRAAFCQARQQTDQWIEAVQSVAPRSRQGRIYKRFWLANNRRAAISI